MSDGNYMTRLSTARFVLPHYCTNLARLRVRGHDATYRPLFWRSSPICHRSPRRLYCVPRLLLVFFDRVAMKPDGGGGGGLGGGDCVFGDGGVSVNRSSSPPPGTAPPPDADAIELYDSIMAATASCAAKDARCSCGGADWGCGAGGDRSDGRGCHCAGACPASAATVRAQNGGSGGNDVVDSGDSSTGGGGRRGGVAASGCFGTRLRHSLDVLGGALRLYGTGRLAIAFNGGKDATVILHLMRAAVAHHRRVVAAEEASLPCSAAAEVAAVPPPSTTTVVIGNGEQLDSSGATPRPTLPPPRPTASPPILSMYITDADAFDEVESFVRATAARYGIEAVDQAGGFKAGIEAFVRCRGVAAFVLGTRRDDPHGGQMEHFEPSSVGWPPFMRVNAILDWTYADVWRFLRRWRLPYAGIYDQGFTSLGGVSNTVANPKLRLPDGSYAPAYCLDDARDERAGRT